jgi:hypothetical protein
MNSKRRSRQGIESSSETSPQDARILSRIRFAVGLDARPCLGLQAAP